MKIEMLALALLVNYLSANSLGWAHSAEEDSYQIAKA